MGRLASFFRNFLNYGAVSAIVRPTRFVTFYRDLAAWVSGYGTNGAGPLNTVPLGRLVPPQSVQLRVSPAEEGELPETELLVLCTIARAREPRRVFEFGTYRGRTADAIARNMHPKGKVITIDLGPDVSGTRIPLGDDPLYDGNFATANVVDHIGEDVSDRIERIQGDSFDVAPERYAPVDLVLIDANHTYDGVRSDSEKAFAMLAKDGVIVWDDYALHPGVTRYLDALSRSRALVRIRNTRLVVYGIEPAR